MTGKIIDAGIVIGLLFMITEGIVKHSTGPKVWGVTLLVIFIIVLLVTKSPRGKSEEKDKK